MASVRANEFVCAADSADGRLYVNALPFQQADCVVYSGDTCDVAAARWPEVLSYWTSRVAAATGRPGLFDSSARHRLAERLLDLAGEAPDMDVWGFTLDAAERRARLDAIDPVDAGDLLVPGDGGAAGG
mmetsp:Transcript_33880/g.103998  ORF Transcript_33880/g.103998 Transcript_33880/m.103998 type:complete len:129 (+) Transcript_33880:720-1106(+)